MSDSSNLIDKTDALLGRYRGNGRTEAEPDFPLLTEVYDRAIPESAIAPEIPAESGGVQTSMQAEPAVLRENALVDEILRQLAPHIEAALGDPLKERLDEHLRRVLAALTGQVRIDVETLVRVAVSQAVDRALSEKK